MTAEDRAREALALAKKFHEAYERLAPFYGYGTRGETREFREGTPNGQLMMAVASELLADLERYDARRLDVQLRVLKARSRLFNLPMSDSFGIFEPLTLEDGDGG